MSEGRLEMERMSTKPLLLCFATIAGWLAVPGTAAAVDPCELGGGGSCTQNGCEIICQDFAEYIVVGRVEKYNGSDWDAVGYGVCSWTATTPYVKDVYQGFGGGETVIHSAAGS